MNIDDVLINEIKFMQKEKESKIWEAIQECIDSFIHTPIYLLNKYLLNVYYMPTLGYWEWISGISIRLQTPRGEVSSWPQAIS